MNIVRFSEPFCPNCGSDSERNHDINGEWCKYSDVAQIIKQRDEYKAILDAQQERIDILTGKRTCDE